MAPTGKHWMNFMYINLAYVTIISVMIYYISIKEIKKNWGQYRCNPMFMVFSDNIVDDFTKCVTTVQNHSIGPLLAPVTSDIGDLKTTSDVQTQQIQENKTSIDNLGFSLDSSMSSMTNQFSSSSAELQKITYGIKDLMGKLSAIAVSMMYVLQGNVHTMKSAWNGPPGQVMRKLGSLGHCFHPETKIKLKNGDIVAMKDVPLGSILENGSKVVSVMKVDASGEPLLKLSSKNLKDIYVTGSHLIKEDNKNTFIPVSNHPSAKPQTAVKSAWYSCLITHNHLIQIDEYTFWDWEDYCCEHQK
jgi:hypothetical protein